MTPLSNICRLYLKQSEFYQEHMVESCGTKWTLSWDVFCFSPEALLCLTVHSSQRRWVMGLRSCVHRGTDRSKQQKTQTQAVAASLSQRLFALHVVPHHVFCTDLGSAQTRHLQRDYLKLASTCNATFSSPAFLHQCN